MEGTCVEMKSRVSGCPKGWRQRGTAILTPPHIRSTLETTLVYVVKVSYHISPDENTILSVFRHHAGTAASVVVPFFWARRVREMPAYPCHMGLVCTTEQLAKIKAAAASTGRSQGAVVRLLIDQMTLGGSARRAVGDRGGG